MLSNPQAMRTPIVYPLVKYSTSVRSILKQRSSEVTDMDFGGAEGLADIVQDMFATMYRAHGVGLAAPQIGIGKRIAVIDISENRSTPIVLINPEIIEDDEWSEYRMPTDDYGNGPQDQIGMEGCLSLPGFRAEVTRPMRVTVKHANGVIRAEGLLARACCHEINHLDGKLFIDHLSGLKRNLILQRIMKLKRKGRW